MLMSYMATSFIFSSTTVRVRGLSVVGSIVLTQMPTL
jgi:hypothetical protein